MEPGIVCIRIIPLKAVFYALRCGIGTFGVPNFFAASRPAGIQFATHPTCSFTLSATLQFQITPINCHIPPTNSHQFCHLFVLRFKLFQESLVRECQGANERRQSRRELALVVFVGRRLVFQWFSKLGNGWWTFGKFAFLFVSTPTPVSFPSMKKYFFSSLVNFNFPEF